MTITSALTKAGIDHDAITETPDCVVTVTAADGSRYAVGDDGIPWLTGTRYSPDGDQEGTDSWDDLTEMATDVAAWARRR